MTDEEKQAIDNFKFFNEGEYITREMAESKDVVLILLEKQQAEIEKKDARIKDLEQKLNAKEILSTSMPPDTEFVIMTRANYERNFGKT